MSDLCVLKPNCLAADNIEPTHPGTPCDLLHELDPSTGTTSTVPDSSSSMVVHKRGYQGGKRR